jgi:hypothetical protein
MVVAEPREPGSMRSLFVLRVLAHHRTRHSRQIAGEPGEVAVQRSPDSHRRSPRDFIRKRERELDHQGPRWRARTSGILGTHEADLPEPGPRRMPREQSAMTVRAEQIRDPRDARRHGGASVSLGGGSRRAQRLVVLSEAPAHLRRTLGSKDRAHGARCNPVGLRAAEQARRR